MTEFAGYEPGEIEAARAAARLENGIIPHPALRQSLKDLRMHQARSLVLDGKEPQPAHLLMVTGEAGAGKTTLLKKHQSKFKSRRTEDGVVMPVVRAEMPSPCTRKGLVEAILSAMGHAASEDWRTNRIVDEIANLTERHHVQMIMIDEADRIFGAETKEVAKFLVSLLNRLKAQIVLAGAPDLELLHTGYGLERRKEEDIRLRPYRWDNDQGQTHFRSLLKVFDHRLGLQKPAGLDEFDLSRRIYVASEGHVGLVSKLLVKALRRSIEEKRSFDVNLLGDVYTSFRKGLTRESDQTIDWDRDVLKDPVQPKSLPRSKNPFFCKQNELKEIWLSQKEALTETQFDERGKQKLRIPGRSKKSGK